MGPQPVDGGDIRRQAQEWIRELPTAGESRRAEFVRWIRHSPKHLHAYMLLELDGWLVSAIKTSSLSLESVLDQASTNVVSMHPTRVGVLHPSTRKAAPGRPRLRRAGYFSLMALVMAGIMVGPQFVRSHPVVTNTTELSTDIGERRTFTLPDHSVIQLNTNSAIRLRYGPNRRDLALLKGEIWIRVASDPARPFSLQDGAVHLQDLGTVFTVRSDDQETSVTVIDGRVRVSTTADSPPGALPNNSDGRLASARLTVELTGGQAATIRVDDHGASAITHIRTLTPLQVASAVAWTQGKLVLNGESVRTALREVNRYHERQLIVTDPSLADTRVGGILDPAETDYRVIVQALSFRCPIGVDDSNPRVIRLYWKRTAPSCSLPASLPDNP